MKLLRAIRFDASDTQVFARAAEPDEWLVSGAGLYHGITDGELKGKLRQAFANGFLGVGSFGHSTFACVALADAGIADAMEGELARQILERYGAPDLEAARGVARDEIAFAADLCRDLAPGTLVTVSRVLDADGSVREAFRTIRPRGDADHNVRLWSDGGDDA